MSLCREDFEAGPVHGFAPSSCGRFDVCGCEYHENGGVWVSYGPHDGNLHIRCWVCRTILAVVRVARRFDENIQAGDPPQLEQATLFLQELNDV